jgi:hypothetical protein
MNKDLDGHIFKIPEYIVDFLRRQPEDPNVDRNKNLLANGMVTYGQLKRILHDMKYMDKKADQSKYNLYGGQPLEDWGKSILKQHRDTIRNTKKSKKIADDLTGTRKNAYNKKHTTSFTPKISMNDVGKSNSEKWSGQSTFSAGSMKLFESINRMKKLMK